MSFTKVEVQGYECAACGKLVPATSPWSADRPEGYYFAITRVTPGLHHKQTPELYVCDKDCLLEFMNFGITHHSQEVVPIGPRPANARPIWTGERWQ